MTRTGRRDWLRRVGAGGALPLVGQVAPATVAHARTADGHVFFTAADIAFLTPAVDRLLPEDGFPSASQAGVLTYIDRQLAGPYGAGERLYLKGPLRQGTPEQGYQLGLPPAAVYRESLDALASHAAGRGFASRAPEEQDAFLRQLEAGRWMLKRVPSAVFFETLLANCIEGYFADPQYGGNRDMAGWRMVGFPGAFANFSQWVGHHGARFSRAPMSIAMTSASAGQGHGAHPRAAPDARAPAPARPVRPDGEPR